MRHLRDSSAAITGSDSTPRDYFYLGSTREQIRVLLHKGVYVLGRSEQSPCVVNESGVATCGRLACPTCSHASGNLSARQLAALTFIPTVACTCGHRRVALGAREAVASGYGAPGAWL